MLTLPEYNSPEDITMLLCWSTKSKRKLEQNNSAFRLSFVVVKSRVIDSSVCPHIILALAGHECNNWKSVRKVHNVNVT